LLIDSLSLIGVYITLIVVVFVTLLTNGRLDYLTGAIFVSGFCLSLVFGLHGERFRSRAIESARDTGIVVYVDTCEHTGLSLLWGVLFGVLMGAPWFIVLHRLSNSMFRIVGGGWIVWFFCFNFLFPIRYTITKKGIWTQTGTVHSFVYFKDLENIYREPKTRLVWPSDKSNPIVRFSDYVVLIIKPECKLPKESRKKHLTPSDPSKFVEYLPPKLLERNGIE